MKEEDFFKEKRKFERYGLKARGEVCFESGKRYKGIFNDISVAGTYFECPGIEDDAVNLFVTMSMDAVIKGELRKMVAECKIVRATDTGVGILFGMMNEVSKGTFHALMQELRDNLVQDGLMKDYFE